MRRHLSLATRKELIEAVRKRYQEKVSGLAAQKCMFLGNRTRLDGALLSERGNWIEALALGW